MATVRIYKVAELLGLSSQEAMDLLKKETGIDVKSASSSIEEIVARQFVERQARKRRSRCRPVRCSPTRRSAKKPRQGRQGARAAEAGRAGAAAAAGQDASSRRPADGGCRRRPRRSPSTSDAAEPAPSCRAGTRGARRRRRAGRRRAVERRRRPRESTNLCSPSSRAGRSHRTAPVTASPARSRRAAGRAPVAGRATAAAAVASARPRSCRRRGVCASKIR